MEEIAKINEIIFLEKIALAIMIGGIIALIGICICLLFWWAEIKATERERKNA